MDLTSTLFVGSECDCITWSCYTERFRRQRCRSPDLQLINWISIQLHAEQLIMIFPAVNLLKILLSFTAGLIVVCRVNIIAVQNCTFLQVKFHISWNFVHKMVAILKKCEISKHSSRQQKWLADFILIYATVIRFYPFIRLIS